MNIVPTLRKRRAHAAASVAVLALALTACGGGSGSSGSDDKAKAAGITLVKSGKLTVCTHLPYKPFQFTQDGETVGFDVDLMDLVADKLGVEQEIFDTPFEGIQSGESLNTGKCDAAAAGMTITDERARVIDFSEPYFDATQALLVKKDSGITSLDDLSGKSLGVQEGTTGEQYANDNAPDDVEVRSFEDLALLTAAVKTGQIDAGINDNGVLFDYVNANPDTEVSAEFDTGEQYGVAVKKDGNDALLKTINQVIEDAKSDGTYDEIYKKWFGDVPQS